MNRQDFNQASGRTLGHAPQPSSSLVTALVPRRPSGQPPTGPTTFKRPTGQPKGLFIVDKGNGGVFIDQDRSANFNYYFGQPGAYGLQMNINGPPPSWGPGAQGTSSSIQEQKIGPVPAAPSISEMGRSKPWPDVIRH